MSLSTHTVDSLGDKPMDNLQPRIIESARIDFPILSQRVNGKAVAYLDSASSAQKPQQVLDVFNTIYNTQYANIHRGLYQFSQVTTEAYENVRSDVAKFINAPSSDEIIFTRNTTESINLVAESWTRAHLSEGDEVIISELEHHANIVPWQILTQKIGVKLKIIPVLDDGTLDFGTFASLLSEKTRFLAISYISNALGTVNDVEKYCNAAKNFNADIKVLIDATQAVVHQAVDVQALNCDFLAFTGHKLYGPNGVGVLWAKATILTDMPPYQGGGDMIETVSFNRETTFKSGAARFEAGTPAITEVIALGAAIKYVESIGFEAIQAHEGALFAYMMDQLSLIDGLTFYGPSEAPQSIGVASFTANWAHISDIAMILDQCGVAVRTGHHCCMPLMERFGIDGTIRASIGLYNNKADIDALISGLKKAKDMLS